MAEVEVSIDGAVATITLHRPPVNSLSRTMIARLIAALRSIDEMDEVRVSIITGRGRCFCAGLDLKEHLAAIEAGNAGPADLGSEMYDTLLNGRKPIIAAVNGPAMGAGVGIAASCNILVASENAVFGLPEIDVGMLGGASHAMRLLGHSTVNRMMLTGHQLDARELYHRRVVEACVPVAELMPFARAIADDIASKDPVAIGLARQSLAQIEGIGVLSGYRHEMSLAKELGKTTGARDAMRAFLERGPKKTTSS